MYRGQKACFLDRLTLYPEFALEPEAWLDSSRGRNSVSAAVLRQSDAHGLLRGSDWVAGQTNSSEEVSSSLQSILEPKIADAAATVPSAQTNGMSGAFRV